MAYKIFDTFNEALKYIEENKKSTSNFKGHICINIEDNNDTEDYTKGLDEALKNPLSEFINQELNSHPAFAEEVLSDKPYNKSICPHSIANVINNNHARFLYDKLIEELLYSKSNVNTEVFINSLYGDKNSPCYISIFEDFPTGKAYINKALVHEYKNRLLCIEISPKVFYFRGEENFTTVNKIMDAEQVILKILTKIYDIDYTQKTYGY